MAKKWKLRSISQRLFFLIITTSFVEPWLWLWNERKPQKLPAQFAWRPKQRELTFKFKCLNLAVRTEEHAELSKRSFQDTEKCVLCTWFYPELLPVALWAVWMDIFNFLPSETPPISLTFILPFTVSCTRTHTLSEVSSGQVGWKELWNMLESNLWIWESRLISAAAWPDLTLRDWWYRSTAAWGKASQKGDCF